MGFGIFMLFGRMHFYIPAVNKLASCSLAVYLITEFPAIATRMWQGPFSLDVMAASPMGFAYAIGLCVAVYLICSAVDAIRQWVFFKCIDGTWSCVFERGWSLLSIRGKALLAKVCVLLGD